MSKAPRPPAHPRRPRRTTRPRGRRNGAAARHAPHGRHGNQAASPNSPGRLPLQLVTPRLHRRHHVPSTTMKKRGGILTLWDRLAGTLVRIDTSDDKRYGVPGEIDIYHVALLRRVPSAAARPPHSASRRCAPPTPERPACSRGLRARDGLACHPDVTAPASHGLPRRRANATAATGALAPDLRQRHPRQHQRRRPQTTQITHNPKVAGSNPAPAGTVGSTV